MRQTNYPAIVSGSEQRALAVFQEDKNGDLIDILYYCCEDFGDALPWPAYSFSPDYNTHYTTCGSMINHVEKDALMPSLDRIGVLEVLSLLAHDYGLYAVSTRLNRLGLQIRPSLRSVTDLEEWQQSLYKRLEPRAFNTDSYTETHLSRFSK